MTKVSVVIPVYNGEKYLRQCLDSVCQQTLTEIEIICVDDGSTDSSTEIIKEYQEKDERIKLYQQQNQFAGAARNLGKSHAVGDYLVFWDCDDFFELTALEKLYNQATEKDADICVCSAKRYYQSKEKAYPWPSYLSKKYTQGMDVFNRSSNEQYILNFTNAAVWNKIFRRKFVEEQDINFQAIRNGNDVFFTINALCLAERITYIEEELVYYRTNQSDSLVGTLSKSPKTPIQAWIDAADSLKKRGAFPEQSFVNKCCDSLVYMLRNVNNGVAFCDAVAFLQEYGLEKLHIVDREDSYYYNQRHPEIVRRLLHDTPEGVRDYLTSLTYIQLTEASANVNLKNAEIKELKEKNKEYQAKTKALEIELKNAGIKNKVKSALKSTPIYPLYKILKR